MSRNDLQLLKAELLVEGHRERLNRFVKTLGLDHPLTIRQSQKLDYYLNQVQQYGQL